MGALRPAGGGRRRGGGLLGAADGAEAAVVVALALGVAVDEGFRLPGSGFRADPEAGGSGLAEACSLTPEAASLAEAGTLTAEA